LGVGLPSPLAVLKVTQVVDALRMVLGVAINDRVKGLQPPVGCVDRVNELAISIRETDAKIQSDFHWISPQREIPAEEERLALSH
jgi:hypothetical protein